MFLTRFDIFWRFRGRIYDMFAVTPEVRNGMMNIYQISFWPCHFLLRTTLISFYDLFGMIFFPVWPLWHEFFSHKFFSHVFLAQIFQKHIFMHILFHDVFRMTVFATIIFGRLFWEWCFLSECSLEWHFEPWLFSEAILSVNGISLTIWCFYCFTGIDIKHKRTRVFFYVIR